MTDLESFERQLAAHHLAPLWKVLRTLTPRDPSPAAVPALWRSASLREQILEASRLITADEAERRVLVLENPALAGQSRITTSLYAGVQLILPGEIARRHRHTATALRLVLEGEGAYTAVGEERADMRPGDFLITPSWTFHEHGNRGDAPVMWLDGLDVPIINLLNAAFSENGAEERSPPQALAPSDALARYGSGLLPVDYEPRGSAPLFCYPYERTREALEKMRRHGPWDEAYGLRLQFTDPTTGAAPMPAMGAFMQLVPRGFTGRPYRSTDGAVFAVLEGTGSLRLGDLSVEVSPWDIWVVPGWCWYTLNATSDLVLFSFSDRPLQRHLRIWREQRG
jgi:gentisate 1,2-dioxygenase